MIGRQALLLRKAVMRASGKGMNTHYFQTVEELPPRERRLGVVQGYLRDEQAGVGVIVEVENGELEQWHSWAIRLLPGGDHV